MLRLGSCQICDYYKTILDTTRTTTSKRNHRQLIPTKIENTTNLFSHLKGYHPSNYTESVSVRAQGGVIPNVRPGDTASVSLGASSSSGSSVVAKQSTIASYEKKSKRSKTITDAITYCLAKDMMPLNTVEKDHFKKLI